MLPVVSAHVDGNRVLVNKCYVPLGDVLQYNLRHDFARWWSGRARLVTGTRAHLVTGTRVNIARQRASAMAARSRPVAATAESFKVALNATRRLRGACKREADTAGTQQNKALTVRLS